ncbi:MAG: hypothetical protein SFX18_16890 [Pirellulales bacterium]|nr:hypothetical protein [Pirellulales bacterium]
MPYPNQKIALNPLTLVAQRWLMTLLPELWPVTLLAALLLWSTGWIYATPPEETLPPPSADGPAVVTTPDVDYWLVSSRGLPCYQSGRDVSAARLAFQHCDSTACRWNHATHAEFLASLDNRPTYVLLHGNRFNFQDAVDFGYTVGEALRGGWCNQPIRIIIWSWPSDQIQGQIQDIQTKAARTTSEGIYLANFLKDLLPGTPVGLVGYSYGARIASGALHLRGGGSLAGYRLPAEATGALGPVRGVFFATAINECWLLPGQPHGFALNGVERALFFNNSLDPALKRYHLVDRNTHPEAIGYVGARIAAVHAPKVRQWDVASSLGKTHDYRQYLGTAWILGRMRSHLNFVQP